MKVMALISFPLVEKISLMISIDMGSSCQAGLKSDKNNSPHISLNLAFHLGSNFLWSSASLTTVTWLKFNDRSNYRPFKMRFEKPHRTVKTLFECFPRLLITQKVTDPSNIFSDQMNFVRQLDLCFSNKKNRSYMVIFSVFITNAIPIWMQANLFLCKLNIQINYIYICLQTGFFPA